MATTAEIQARLNLYLAAEIRVLKNQTYTIGTRTFTMANLKWIQDQIKKLKSELLGSAGLGTMNTRRVLFRDD